MSMKQSTIAVVLCGILCGALPGFAADGFAEPILLTSCGQSADVLMMKTLLARDTLAFDYMPDAAAADISGKGSLLVVLGGSSKGLGAAKISEQDEIARVAALLSAAAKAKIPILAVHMGGAGRRGALSDPFNQIGAQDATLIAVVKGGNDDGFFTKLAADKGITLETVENALQLSPLVQRLYGKTAE